MVMVLEDSGIEMGSFVRERWIYRPAAARQLVRLRA